jgi:hypothetical protein
MVRTNCVFGVVAAFVLALLLLPGCSQNDQAIPTAAPNPPIADVPIPDGMTIDLSESQSTVVPESNLRLVNHVYKGSVPELSVTRFFLQELPTQGWQYVQETQNPEGITLFFTKGREDCTITVAHSWFTTKAYVSIAPSGSTSDSDAATQP